MKPITLFDVRINKICRGSISLVKERSESTVKLVESSKKGLAEKWLYKRYPENLLTKEISKARSKTINYKNTAFALLLFAIFGISSLVMPIIAAEVSTRISNLSILPALANNPLSPSPEKKEDPEKLLQYALHKQEMAKYQAIEAKEFRIFIPKINVESNIIANVDPTSEEEYVEKLKQGIAHAKGSYLPGDNGTIVLFSHSTDTPANILQYNAKFYAVKDLEIGDQIEITFGDKKYVYQIIDKKVINPTELESIRQTDANLVLQTCWPPGTNWNRLVVFAKLWGG